MILFAEIECIMYEGHSLKQKRSVLKRLMARLQKDLNVAVTELDYHDLWQRTKLGIVTISNDLTHSEKVIQEALRIIDDYPELERTITNTERI
ncbi:DUF503 domain-containing protein [Virgibacillus halodenitrificans]|jgi:uncharacterized protein|uniref:DUF503 family protein n=1 Tax=Virgibacillus halodenitrificans TaxID=1482 RepID=A0AAC9IZB6_VIRHA|nr:DUF503 family protein [Virgibacillus halodenitrificans]APC48591.1 hypothetical protein BME96_10545 [Virgibacillus halodenitrificans]MBD1224206.1 DUF503 family protein [Virgibacillus halodenitrificans]MCG1028741.1 DUF503 family protein [Virgibacillus halodenitrificans]MCJ0931165.1 DUF503 family protein [Virgibacillus halodenitrificans]MYL46003.1 DUF503 family protein [Virgibacillus halodenitrificans]